MIKPHALKKGDKVALVAPASRPESALAVARAQKAVEKMGFKPVLAKHALSMNAYLAGSDEQRASDIMEAFEDDSIKGIFCLSGGYGSIRILKHLNFATIKKNPKVIMGSHDNSALLIAIQNQTGLVVFHGANICSIDKVEALTEVKSALTNQNVWPAVTPNLNSFPGGFNYSPFEGVVQGTLIGGNLNALISLMGTKYSAHFNNKVVFFCERNERNDIIERWFTSLYLAGHLKKIAGIAFGEFPDCGSKDSNSMESYQDMLCQRVLEHKIPSSFNLPLGDSALCRVVPLGIKVKFDASKGKIDFLESCFAT